jgi:hypothetical protein
MIPLKNEIPLPDDDPKSIHQNFENVLKKLHYWEERIGQQTMEQIINKSLNNKNIIAAHFYTEEQLNNLSEETKNKINWLINEYKEFKQLLILNGLLKTFSEFEIQKIKQDMNELSPDLLNKMPLFIIWFMEEIKKEIIDSSEMLNIINDLDE